MPIIADFLLIRYSNITIVNACYIVMYDVITI